MVLSLNKKIINTLFFLIVFMLIFNKIPEVIEFRFLAGIISNELLFFPLFIGLIYTGYCRFKNKNVFVNFNEFMKYIFAFGSISFISLIIGLMIYPYYDLILNGPIAQIDKLPKVLDWLCILGFDVKEQFLLILWMIVRVIKNLFLDILYTFFGAYIIYCWYYTNWKTSISILLKAMFCSIIVIFLYSFVELFYLLGSDIATNILINITPFIHGINNNNTWWPPLLWKGQLRSIFAEPSYFGMYAAFAMPFLWYKFVVVKNNKRKLIYALIITVFSFLLFLTKARTAVALFSGEVCILLVYMIYLRNKAFIKNVLLICSCAVIAFTSANIFIPNMANTKNNAEISIEGYLEDNLGSLASTEKRSNTARYSIMLANLNIGMDYPLLGVGLNLNDAYIPEYLPEMSENNREVNMWINDQNEKGVLKSGFPSLGEYTSRFAETGIIGLIVFFLPAVILLKSLMKKILSKNMEYNNRIMYMFFSISFIGTLAVGIGDSINITYCYWVLLGLGYAMCFGKPGDDIKHE